MPIKSISDAITQLEVFHRNEKKSDTISQFLLIKENKELISTLIKKLSKITEDKQQHYDFKTLSNTPAHLLKNQLDILLQKPDLNKEFRKIITEIAIFIVDYFRTNIEVLDLKANTQKRSHPNRLLRNSKLNKVLRIQYPTLSIHEDAVHSELALIRFLTPPVSDSSLTPEKSLISPSTPASSSKTLTSICASSQLAASAAAHVSVSASVSLSEAAQVSRPDVASVSIEAQISLPASACASSAAQMSACVTLVSSSLSSSVSVSSSALVAKKMQESLEQEQASPSSIKAFLLKPWDPKDKNNWDRGWQSKIRRLKKENKHTLLNGLHEITQLFIAGKLTTQTDLTVIKNHFENLSTKNMKQFLGWMLTCIAKERKESSTLDQQDSYGLTVEDYLKEFPKFYTYYTQYIVSSNDDSIAKELDSFKIESKQDDKMIKEDKPSQKSNRLAVADFIKMREQFGVLESIEKKDPKKNSDAAADKLHPNSKDESASLNHPHKVNSAYDADEENQPTTNHSEDNVKPGFTQFRSP